MLILLFDGGKTHKKKKKNNLPGKYQQASVVELRRIFRGITSLAYINESKGKWKIPSSGCQAI